MFRNVNLVLFGAVFALPNGLQAKESNEQASHTVLEEIRVVAHPLAENGTAQNLTVVSGDELAREVNFSLGETLSGQAGIQSASFGSAVGRPIIHGLAGARVKTTEDRIDTLDVSVTSGDHAVGVDPLIAEQITVLRGPSTLLYGSGAIGGVVDVDTSRIHEVALDQASGRVRLSAADNASATSGAIVLDAPLSSNAVLHVDGFFNDADDYDIPGFAESAFQIAAEEAEEDEHGHAEGEEEDEAHGHDEEEEAFGVLEGSRAERQGGAIGLSFVGDRGFIGLSVSGLNSTYGLVGGHGHEEDEEEAEHEDDVDDDVVDHLHEEEEEGVGLIDLEQTRFDIEAQLNNPFAGFDSINFRLGFNDYQHEEIEGNGEVGTRFDNEAWEGRVELRHKPVAGFDGALGLQFGEREFSAIGEEAFVPPVDSDSLGVFWVGQRELGQLELEAGVRLEQVDYAPSVAELPDLDFNTFSASVGLVRNISDDWTVAGTVDVSRRAPTLEELYSDGPHLATSAFEIGDPSLEEEQVTSFNLSTSYRNDSFTLDSSVYLMQFDDYIYEVATGEEEDGLPVFRWRQDDAKFIGLNVQGLVHLVSFADGDLDFNFMFDLVRGELGTGSGNQNLPRIPASRSSFGLSWESPIWQVRADYLMVDDQRRIADFELPTSNYQDLSVFVQRTLLIADNELSLYLHGRNLTDDEQRHHGSIVKDFAPAPGRRVEVGVRLEF